MGRIEDTPRAGTRRNDRATSPAFRWIVPAALAGMGLVAAGIAFLAAAVLMGWIPYPGR